MNRTMNTPVSPFFRLLRAGYLFDAVSIIADARGIRKRPGDAIGYAPRHGYHRKFLCWRAERNMGDSAPKQASS